MWLLACVLLAVGLWSYSTSFSGVLFGDDDAAIAQNTSIRALWPPAGPLTPPRDTTLAARPIANLTFAVNYALAAGTSDLWGYHAVNLVIHLLAGLALFGIVRRSLLTPPLRERFGDASASLAFGVAAVWLAHPLHTGAVTFLVQRVESLMGLFYLATVYCVIRAAESDFRNQKWTVAAVAACALGMGTKETMVSAPIVVALWIWICRPDIRLSGPPRRLLVGLAATLIIVIALAATDARSGSAGFGVKGWTWWSYLRTQAGVIVHYLQLAFWPRPLVFQYGWLPAGSWGAVMPQLVLIGSLGIATVVALVRRMPVALIGAWFFLILAPSSSIVPISTEVAAEHRMYLPLAAVVVLVVLGVYVAWRAVTRQTPATKPILGGRFAQVGDGSRLREQDPSPTCANLPPKIGFVAAWLAVAAVTVALASATHDRNRVYASAELMAADVVVNRPQNAQAQLTYGSYLVGQRRFAEAEPHLRIALTLPLSPSTDEATSRSLAHLYLGMALSSQSKFAEGSTELEQAIALRPDLDRAYGPLAEARLSQGEAGAALAILERAIARRPDDPTLLKRAAWVLATSSNATVRNGARAVQFAEKAVTATESRDPVALDVLAAAYAEAGQFDRALVALGKAADLIRASGETDMVAMLRGHLALFEVRRPVRTKEW